MAHRFISKEVICVRKDLVQVFLEVLADERCRQVEAEDLVVQAGVLCDLEHGIGTHGQRKALDRKLTETMNNMINILMDKHHLIICNNKSRGIIITIAIIIIIITITILTAV